MLTSRDLILIHYTHPETAQKIVQTGIIRAGRNTRGNKYVYVTDLLLPPEDVESYLIVGKETHGKGRAYVIIHATTDALDRLEQGNNWMEMRVRGNVRHGKGFYFDEWSRNER